MARNRLMVDVVLNDLAPLFEQINSICDENELEFFYVIAGAPPDPLNWSAPEKSRFVNVSANTLGTLFCERLIGCDTVHLGNPPSCILRDEDSGG